MGVFPHFFSGSPIKHVANVILPGLPLGAETLKFGAKLAKPLVSQAVSAIHHAGAMQTTPTAVRPGAGYIPTNQPYPYVPSTPLYGQSPFAPSPYQYAPAPETFSPYGGQSWGYSTTSPQVYQTPSPVYFQAPSQTSGRSWEDLTLAALPLFL